MSAELPEIIDIIPVQLKIAHYLIGPREAPDTHRRQSITERVLRHRFTIETPEPLAFPKDPRESPYAIYRRGITQRTATYVPTYWSQEKQALQIQSSYVRRHPDMLLAPLLHTLVLVTFDRPNRYPEEIIFSQNALQDRISEIRRSRFRE